MMNNSDEKFMAEKIRSRYIPKENTEFDDLRTLDARVRRPANVFASVFGAASALVMGAGMSLAMTDIGYSLNIPRPMTVGIVIGIIGIVMAALTYPIYKKILTNRREKYADQIIELSDTIVKRTEW